MRRAYVVEHWSLTLLLAPFISQGIQYAILPNQHQLAGLLEIYPLTLAFSIVFSLPTFFVYLFSFYFLGKHDVSPAMSKFLLIAVAIIGIYITQTIIKGSMSQEIIIAYSVTAIIVGLVLRLKTYKKKGQNNPVVL